MEPANPSRAPAWYRTGNGRALLVAIGVAALYGGITHWQHVAPFLPWLLLAACPLMHVFMHRGHGHHGTPPDDASTPPSDTSQRS